MMSNDKSLRDIWTATDKMSLDVLNSAGGVPESCNASVITTTSSKEKCEAYISNQTQETYLRNTFGKQPIPCGLFLQPPKENGDEDETMSLISSIWTPTLKDECIVKKDYQKNPLLVVKIPGKESQQDEDKTTIPKDDSCEKLLEFSSDSELSNNCGSDESQDELNDETFGESKSSKPEMTMTNISEATANCEVLNKQSQKTRKEKRSESTDSNNSEKTIVEKDSDKSQKNDLGAGFTRINSETQTNQRRVRAPRFRNRPRGRRNVDYKVLNSKFSHLGMESDEVLSVSRENLTVQELHSSNRNGGRMSNVKKNIAIETRKFLGKGGSTKKVTYVREKIVEETNGAPNKNSKWNTDLCNLKVQNRNTVYPSPPPNRAPQTKLEENSNRLSNSKESPPFRHFKKGKPVIDDCRKRNGPLNFTRQGTKDHFNHPKKSFEPRYKCHADNVRDNKHSTIPKNIFPNYPAKATNRMHLERKVINSQNYKKSFEEDMRSEVSWNIVTPEKEIKRETTVKKSFYIGAPAQTFSESLSKSSQPFIQKRDQPSQFSQYDKSCYDKLNDHCIFQGNLKTSRQESETATLANQIKKSDQLPKFSENDRSYDDKLYDALRFQEYLKFFKKKEETESPYVSKSFYQDNQSDQLSPKSSLKPNQIRKSDQMPNFAENERSYNDKPYDYLRFHENLKTVKKLEETETPSNFVSKPSYQTNQSDQFSPKFSLQPNQIKKSDQLPNISEKDRSYNDKAYGHLHFQEYSKTFKKEETEAPNRFVSKSLYQANQSDQLSKSSQNDKCYDQLNDHFIFHENLYTMNKETETLPKFIPEPPTKAARATENLSFMRSAKLKEERAQKKSLLIKDGKEVADLVVGCHTAVDVFSSFYNEWLTLREESIDLLEKIMVEIIKCARNNGKIKDAIAGLNIAAGAAGYIPHKGISLGAKIAAAIGGFVVKLFGNEFNEKDKNAKEFEVRQTFQKDIDTSSMVYIYGVQCSSQFEETRQAINALHQRTQDSFELFMSDTSVITFLKEISEYNPSNVSVFYKILRCEYERLIKKSKSDESRAFIKVFEVLPQAVPVIDLLPWKFEPDGFDNSIVQNAWEELFSLFNDNGLSSNDDFLRKIQNCLFFLKKEKAILHGSVRNLLKETLK